MTTLKRREGWEARLAALANAHRSTPYFYGRHDCWTFARAAVEAVTGAVMLPALEPYIGWLGAARVLISHGWASVEDMMIEALGTPCDPAASRSGDVVSWEAGGERHLAVRIGDVAIAPAHEGAMVIEPARWQRAWRVG